jgi:TolA-binding protein
MWSRHTTTFVFLFFGLAGSLNSQAQSPDESTSIDQPSTEVRDPSTLVKLELLEEFERLDRSIRELRSTLDELARAMELSKQEQGKKIADLEGRASTIESSDRVQREEKLSFEAEYKALSKKVEVLEQFLKRNLGGLVSASSVASKEKELTTVPEKNKILNDKLESYSDVNDFYEYVYEVKFKNGEYRDAVKLFSDIVTQYPDHNLVPNAKYWIALSYLNFDPSDKQRALETASALLDGLPQTHNKYADTLLLMGQIYFNLRQCDSAKEYWARVISELPASEAAKKARARIELMCG